MAFKKGDTPWWIKRGLENPMKNQKVREKVSKKMKGKEQSPTAIVPKNRTKLKEQKE